MPRIRGDNLADHRERTWTALVEALDSLLAERAFEQISLGDVAARAGIARNTVYNYARDKTALLAAAVTHSDTGMARRAAEIAGQGSVSPSARLAGIVDTLLRTFSTETHRLFVLESQLRPRPAQDPAAEGPFAEVRSAFATVLSEGVATGEFQDTGDADLDIDLLSGLLEAAVRRIAHDSTEARRVIEHTKGLVLRSLRAR